MLINASHYIAKLPILAATSVNKPSCLATQPIKIKLIKYNEVRLAGQGDVVPCLVAVMDMFCLMTPPSKRAPA